MGVKFTAEQNNEVYRQYDKFKSNWRKSEWLDLWLELEREIENIFYNRPGIKIIELGCGTGQFAKMLYDYEYLTNNTYKGYDYSSYAIEIAKSDNHELSQYFIIKDIEKLKKKDYFDEFHLVVATEVLEHCDDIKVLKSIPKGTLLLASVPSFDSMDHIIHFNNKEEIIERYSKFIEIDYCYKYHQYFIFRGYVK